MHCKNCDYPLWNLRARQCPECGQDFRPSEYEFVCNSVQFCCPHCNQAYYGTGERGALVPRRFTCVSCGGSCDIDEMVLRPAEGVTEGQTTVDEHPWMARGGRNVVSRWFKTAGQSMVAPASLGRAIAANPDVRSAWRFAFLTMAIVTVLGFGVPMAFIGILSAAGGGGFDVDDVLAIMGGLAVYVVLFLVCILLWTLLAHGVLLISGGAKGTIGRTCEVALYSSGTTAGMAIPCLGPYCASQILLVWWVVSACIMLGAAMKVHGGRATLAGLTYPVIVILVVVVAYAALVFAILNTARATGPTPRVTMGGTAAVSGTGEMRQVAASMQMYAISHNNQYPAHALDLVGSNVSALGDFITIDSDTYYEDVPTPGGTLESLDESSPTTIRNAARQAANALPSNVVAHRLGDFVFTYHGIQSQNVDPGLWVSMLAWDPDVNIAQNDPVYAGTTQGAVVTIPHSSLPQQLAQQNQLRAKYNLPPLPDPFTVTHGAPATSNNAGDTGSSGN